MNAQKNTMAVLAQIVKLIPGKIIDTLARNYRIQTRAFSPTNPVVAVLYSQLSHALSLNDMCDGMQNHAGTRKSPFRTSISRNKHCIVPLRP